MTDRSSAERLAHDALTALTDLAQALRTLDVVDQGRRKTEQARHQVESLVTTLRQLSTRVTALLDEIEEPVKKLALVADQLGPMLAMLGMKPPTATPSAATASAATAAATTPPATAPSASSSPEGSGTGATGASAG